MTPLDEVAPGLWLWTSSRHGLPPTMTAYAMNDGEDTILVDPLVVGETAALLATLDEIVRGRVRILVTTPFHVRGSELLWRRWRDRHEVTIFGHEQCAKRLEDRSAFRPLRQGEAVEGGVRAHAMGRPPRAELPFELPSHHALAFGDTVLEVEGQLRVWPRHRRLERTWHEEVFLPTLEPLTRLDIERVLVTHGVPVLRDGADALTAALARPPWGRSSFYWSTRPLPAAIAEHPILMQHRGPAAKLQRLRRLRQLHPRVRWPRSFLCVPPVIEPLR